MRPNEEDLCAIAASGSGPRSPWPAWLAWGCPGWAAWLPSAGTISATAAAAHWSRVTPLGTDTIDDVGLVHGNDGVLHVLWASDATPNQAIMDTAVGASGTVGTALLDSNGIATLAYTVPADGVRQVAAAYDREPWEH